MVLGTVASMGNLVCLICETAVLQKKAFDLSLFLQAPLNPLNVGNFSYKVYLTEQGLHLEDKIDRVLRIDFVNDHLNYQRKGLRGKNELLAKALGFSKGVRKVLDLSAGLGIDAVFMTNLGFEVVALERAKLVYALLREALTKAPDIQARLSLVNADAFEFLSSSQNSSDFDAIYFDPMYPHKKKSALPKQEMVLFRDLVGNDEDAAQVLNEALKWSVKRVVVKRPTGAEALLPGVRHSFEGKVVRYDIYMRSQ